jgi:hypothetical protein
LDGHRGATKEANGHAENGFREFVFRRVIFSPHYCASKANHPRLLTAAQVTGMQATPQALLATAAGR